tara:strand:- start:1036 stop:1203 length:168 start_codon:yes stop_codon:yes gene_type:complete
MSTGVFDEQPTTSKIKINNFFITVSYALVKSNMQFWDKQKPGAAQRRTLLTSGLC